jgi:hypothetical protein
MEAAPSVGKGNGIHPGMGIGVGAAGAVRITASMPGVGMAYGDDIHGEVTVFLLCFIGDWFIGDWFIAHVTQRQPNCRCGAPVCLFRRCCLTPGGEEMVSSSTRSRPARHAGDAASGAVILDKLNGTPFHFAYTYLLMAFGGAYNQLFLVYVALYSASLFACILALLAIDVKQLARQVSPRFARRTIAWLVIGFSAMLTLLWLGRIVPALISGVVPFGLESYSTLFVQAGDLGLVVPLGALTGALLLSRHPAGYLLAGVILVKGATLGLALMAMAIAMAIAGVAIAPVEVVFFTVVAVVCAVGTVHLLRHLPRLRHEPVRICDLRR